MSEDEQNLIESEKIRSRLRDRARVFREVFGERGKPTAHGKIIIDALLVKFGDGGHKLPMNILDDHGRVDALQTWRHLGHYDVLEYIYTQLDWKESAYVDPSSTGS